MKAGSRSVWLLGDPNEDPILAFLAARCEAVGARVAILRERDFPALSVTGEGALLLGEDFAPEPCAVFNRISMRRLPAATSEANRAFVSSQWVAFLPALGAATPGALWLNKPRINAPLGAPSDPSQVRGALGEAGVSAPTEEFISGRRDLMRLMAEGGVIYLRDAAGSSWALDASESRAPRLRYPALAIRQVKPLTMFLFLAGVVRDLDGASPSAEVRSVIERARDALGLEWGVCALDETGLTVASVLPYVPTDWLERFVAAFSAEVDQLLLLAS